MQILERKAPCQLDADEDEDDNGPTDQPAEQSEYDAMLICSACDLVAGLSKALGEEFGQAFGSFYPVISNYYVSTAADILAVCFVLTLSFAEPSKDIQRALDRYWLSCRGN